VSGADALGGSLASAPGATSAVDDIAAARNIEINVLPPKDDASRRAGRIEMAVDTSQSCR
jgi:hypothetical protein